MLINICRVNMIVNGQYETCSYVIYIISLFRWAATFDNLMIYVCQEALFLLMTTRNFGIIFPLLMPSNDCFTKMLCFSLSICMNIHIYKYL